MAEFQCLKCHNGPAMSAFDSKGMFELNRSAPRLGNLQDRRQGAWLVQWLQFPGHLRNKTTMPKVWPNQSEKKRAVAISHLVAYLFQTERESQEHVDAHPHFDSAAELAEQIESSSDEVLRKGMSLFEMSGCIACHHFAKPSEEDEYDRVSLHYVSAKYPVGSVVKFLENPRADDPWSRMPVFRFSKEERISLEAYLRSRSKGNITKDSELMSKGNPRLGEELYKSIGCANCHSFPHQMSNRQKQVPSKVTEVPFLNGNSNRGCLYLAQEFQAQSLDESLPDSLPLFRVSPEQYSALKSIWKPAYQDSFKRRVPLEFAARQTKRLKCHSCHIRDAKAASLPLVLAEVGETGLPHEMIPPLTWAGEKLQLHWAEQVLTGKLKYKVREHLKAQMPHFPTRGKLIATGLLQEHGMPEEVLHEMKYDSEKSSIGEKLVMSKGFACHRCHAIGKLKPDAPLESRSTNLAYARGRLRFDYYQRWMLNPQRIDANTRMLRFAPDGKTTQLKSYYEGDATRQFDAIWHYLWQLNAKQKTEEGVLDQ